MNRLVIKNCSKQLGKYNLIKSKGFFNGLNTNGIMKLDYNYADSKRLYKM